MRLKLLRHGGVLLFVLGLMALFACHGPTQIAGVQTPMGRLALSIHEASPAHATGRHVAALDATSENAVKLYVSGEDLSGWSHYLGAATFGPPDPVTGMRVATFNLSGVPAGQKRIFRADLLDGAGTLLDRLGAVADVLPTVTTHLVMDRSTTPVAQIFYELLTTGDAARTLALNATDVQHLVDQVVNTDSTVGGAPIASGVPQVNYALLDPTAIAVAIANGASGTAYVVPGVVPPNLIPAPTHEASVTLTVLDSRGQPDSATAAVSLSDPISVLTIPAVNASTPLNVNFTGVPVGPWQINPSPAPSPLGWNYTATVTDLQNGKQVIQTVPVWDHLTTAFVVDLPLNEPQVLAGAASYQPNGLSTGANWGIKYPNGINLSNPVGLVKKNGILYFADSGLAKIFALDLTGATPTLTTIAGNGASYTSVAAEGAGATSVPIGINGACHLALDESGNLLFSEQLPDRIAKVDLSTGALTTFVDLQKVSTWGFYTYTHIGPIAYDVSSRTLYAGVSNFILGGTMVSVSMSAYPTAGCSKLISGNFSGGMALSGNSLFYSTSYGDYKIYRRDITTSVDTAIVAGNSTQNDIPALGFGLGSGHTVGGEAYSDLTLDGLGNLYFLGYGIGYSGTLVRITNALSGDTTSNQWTTTDFGVHNPWANGATSLYADPISETLYVSGPLSIPNPNGNNNVSSQTVYRVAL
jgi:hypothetical protein